MKNTTSKLLSRIPLLLICTYMGVFIVSLTIAVFTQAPRELRDAANVSFATQIANLQNPYSINSTSEFIESINVYPPLNMIFAAVIYKISHFNLYNIFYALDYIYIMLTAFAITYYVKKEYHTSATLTALTFAISLTLGWRIDFISTIPDHLGMLICVVLLLAVHKNKSLFLQALLTTLTFYSKQYFLAIAAPVFIYYCITDRNKAIKYFIYTAVLGLTSVFIVHCLCPSFSIQILFFMFAENEGINMDKILYSGKQMFLAFATYGVYSLCIFLKYAHAILLRIKKKICTPLTVFDINNILMFFILLYLGTNKGAFLSYHLTLLIPCFIISGTEVLTKACNNIRKSLQLPLHYMICILSLFLVLYKYHLPYIQTQEDQNAYTRLKNIITEYEGTKYLTPQLGYIAHVNAMPLSENGHAEYLITLADSKIIKTPIDINNVSKVFPYMNTIYDYSISRKANIISAIQNKEYSLITQYNGSHKIYNFDITEYYKCIEQINVQTGIQTFTIDIYIPK